MKRNINILVLTFEVAAIVILHAVKINHSREIPVREPNTGISNTKNINPLVKNYGLLSIK